MKNKKKLTTPVSEDQALLDEIMSEVERMRQEDGMVDSVEAPAPEVPAEKPAAPVQPKPEQPVAPPPSPEIPQRPVMPEMPQQPQRTSGSEISFEENTASAKTPGKKKKGFPWFKRNKNNEFNDWEIDEVRADDDIYYGLKLKPMDEYRKEMEASGRKNQVSEPTSSFPHLFEQTTPPPDLSSKFEELHRERQERISQAVREAGVEPDDIYSLYDEGQENEDLAFDYDEWKRNTQPIPVIQEEDLAAAEEIARQMEAQRTAKQQPQTAVPEEDAVSSGQDTLQFTIRHPVSPDLVPETKLPVEHVPSGQTKSSDSIEAKELEVDRLLQQVRGNQSGKNQSIFERVAMERSAQQDPEESTDPVSEAGQPAAPQTKAATKKATETASLESTQKIPAAAVPWQEEATPVEESTRPIPQELSTFGSEPYEEDPFPGEPPLPPNRYRFNPRPVRIFKLGNVDRIVADEYKSFTEPLKKTANPYPPVKKKDTSREIYSVSPDVAVVKNAVAKVISSESAKDGDDGEECHTPSPVVSSVSGGTGVMPKVISIPLKQPADSGAETADTLPDPDEEFEDLMGKRLHKRKKLLHFHGEEEEENEPEDEFQPPASEIEDYDNPEDSAAVLHELKTSSRELTIRMLVTGISTIVLIALGFFCEICFPHFNTLAYLVMNLIFLLIPAGFCYRTLFNGVTSLLRLQANSDSSAAVTVIAGIIHSCALFFSPSMVSGGLLHLYSSVAIGALFLNALGKLSMIHRIRRNFKFLSSSDEKFNVQIYDNEDVAIQMVREYIAETPVIAYQQRTRFLKGFLHNSYEPDPSENTSQIIAPIAFVASLVLCIVCTIITGSVISGLTAFAIATCIATPLTNMLCVNLPIARLCRIARRSSGMAVGYKAIEKMADTNAVMIDSTDLFPKGSVSLSGMKTFGEQRIDRAILQASALMCSTGGTLREVFENVIQNQKGMLPQVENISYEDEAGVLGFVEGHRILVGKRALISKYNVELPDHDFEKKYVTGSKQATYLAVDNKLVAMFILTYEPDAKKTEELQRLESNGIAIIVRTLDPNISPEFLADRFRLDARAIRVLPASFGPFCDRALNDVTDEEEVYLATKGKAFSMMRMITACIRQKSNISIAVILQTVCIILGFALVAFFSCWSGLQQLSSLAILIYEIFWILAILLIPRIRKP